MDRHLSCEFTGTCNTHITPSPLTHNQSHPPTLTRMGVLFCPLLPIIGLVKYIIIFYCRSGVVYYCNHPPHTVFRISSTLNFYMGILLATTILSSFPVGYAMLQMVPSGNCGPFR